MLTNDYNKMEAAYLTAQKKLDEIEEEFKRLEEASKHVYGADTDDYRYLAEAVEFALYPERRTPTLSNST